MNTLSRGGIGHITKLGKYLYVTPLGIFGIMHLMGAEQLAPQYNVPLGVAGVIISGVAMLMAAISFYIGKLDKLASVLLAVLMLVYIVSLHIPQASKGGPEGFLAIIGIFRDVAMAGGALMYAHSQAKDRRVTG